MIELRVKLLNGRSKIRGLLGSKKAYPVLLKTRFGIHTLGMKFPIDVIILDKNNFVVKLAKNLKPNHIFLWNPLYETCIELPTGEIAKRKIVVGEKTKIIILS